MSSNIGRSPKAYISEKVTAGNITAHDGEMILAFIGDRNITKHTMAHTEASYARYLTRAIELMGKPIKSWDYKTFVAFIELVKKEYKPNTHRKHIGSIKLFLLFLIKNGVIKSKSLAVEQITPVELPKPNRMTKVAGDMLSMDDVTAIIRGAKNSRDRAIISILFEAGCRPQELLDLTWSDVNFDQYGATLNTAGKTGKPRRIRIISMVPHLVAWKNDYPGEPTGNAPVFVNLDTAKGHHSITRGALKKLLAKAVASSGVNKRVHPYLFRHSRVTNMLAAGIPTSVIGLQFWGSLDSQMLKTYGHLSDQQTDDILLQHTGIKPKETKQMDTKPITCPKCSTENVSGLTFCGTCGAPLDPVKYQQSLEADTSENVVLKKKLTAMEQEIADLKDLKHELIGLVATLKGVKA